MQTTNQKQNLYLHAGLDSPTLPPVQVFDKTLTVKQLHVLEPQDLLVARADKGKICVCFYIYMSNKYGTILMWVEKRVWNNLPKKRDQSKVVKESLGPLL